MFALAVAGLALSTVLLSKLPWLTLRRTVYSRAITLLRCTCHPRALVSSACGTFGSVLLYYIFANASGVGHGVVGGRGGTGDHLWGQLIYQCSLWEDDMPTSVSGLSSTNANGERANYSRHMRQQCATHLLITGHGRMDCDSSFCVGGGICAVVPCGSPTAYYAAVPNSPLRLSCSTSCLFRSVGFSVSTFCRRAGNMLLSNHRTVYGKPALEGTNGIIDTPTQAALHWNQSMLASLMICWANSILVHFSMLVFPLL